jgi:hypothetical protein
MEARPTIRCVAAFTLLHVAISLVGIFTGFAVTLGLLKSQRMDATTAIFLVTTAATSVTGFLFPVHHIMPSHVVGIISIIALSVTAYARYQRGLTGAWRRVYAAGAVFSFYLNFFVLVAQAFAKIPALTALAPTQSEPPFAIAQGVVLIAFAVVGVMAIIRFRPAP